MLNPVFRAKARFGAYLALAFIATLVAAFVPGYRVAALAILAVVVFWWLRLDPVGPNGREGSPDEAPARVVAQVRARLAGFFRR